MKGAFSLLAVSSPGEVYDQKRMPFSSYPPQLLVCGSGTVLRTVRFAGYLFLWHSCLSTQASIFSLHIPKSIWGTFPTNI